MKANRYFRFVFVWLLIVSLSANLFGAGIFIYRRWAAPNPTRSLSELDRQEQLNLLRPSMDGIVLLGDSHIDRGEWSELLYPIRTFNRGISGDTVIDVDERLHDILSTHPQCLLLMVGFNDLASDASPEQVLQRYRTLLQRIQSSSKHTRVLINLLWPIRSSEYPYAVMNNHIETLNAGLEALAGEFDAVIENTTPKIVANSSTELNHRYSRDGVHLNGYGYVIWARQIRGALQAMSCTKDG